MTRMVISMIMAIIQQLQSIPVAMGINGQKAQRVNVGVDGMATEIAAKGCEAWTS